MCIRDRYLLGDANLDGIVNAVDLNAVGVSWNQDVSLWSAGDFSADGTVDATDLNAIGVNWQMSNIPPQPIGVPEPDALALAIFVFLAGMIKRSRILRA